MTELRGNESLPGASTPEATRPDWALRIPFLVLVVAIAVRVVVLMAMSRDWFFVIDDWDYLSRTGITSVFEPHYGHLTGGVAFYALVARKVIGYDYWPLYPLAVAFSWPAVSLAAYWLWRKRGIARTVAAGLAVLLLWLATASWLQFAFAGVGYAIALSVLAIHVDELPLNARNVAVGLALGAAATFITSIGAIALFVRMALALVYRRWTGVAATVPVAIAYGLLRIAWGAPPGTPSTGVWGSNIVEIARLSLEIVGAGFQKVLPIPGGFGEIVGLAFVIGVVAVLARARLPYFGVTGVAIGLAYLGSIVLVRIVGDVERVSRILEQGYAIDAQVSSIRFPNTVIALAVIAIVPFIPALTRQIRRPVVLIAILGLLTAFAAVGTVDRWSRISDRSAVAAEEIAGFVVLRRAGEPFVDQSALLFPNTSQRFTVALIDRMIREGWDESLLASDVYGDGFDLTITPEARGRYRFDVTEDGPSNGTWAALGAPSDQRCRKLTDGDTFVVTEAVTIELQGRRKTTLIWTDRFGDATWFISKQDWRDADETLFAELAVPDDSDTPTTITFVSPRLTVCLDTVGGP